MQLMIKEWTPALAWGAGLFVFLLFVAWGGAWFLRRVCRARLLKHGDASDSLRWEIFEALVPLVRWGLSIAALAAATYFLDLPPVVGKWTGRLLQAALVLLVAFVSAAAVHLALNQWAKRARDPGEARNRATLAPLLARICQVCLVTLAVLLALQNSGYNVASLIAGLGLGGLAVALAAKETLANLFGSLAVLMDRTFQVGDTIRTGDTTGVVVRIGLRSTRVRTAEGHIVSIPNQIITNAPVTNMGQQPTRA